MACLAHARVQSVRLQTPRRHRTSALVARAAVEPAVSRREVFASLVSAVVVGSLISVGPAQARDFKAALAEKEARKAKLRDTAGSMKKTGEDKQTFKDAEYAVSEEARTPNIHSRQNEGARTQENA